MRLSETRAEQAFRQGLRDWLTDNLPTGWREGRRAEPARLDERFAFRHDWHRRLAAGGWIGLSWPAEYGGGGNSVIEQLLYHEEMAAAEAPPIANWVGVEVVAPCLVRWGSEAQKRAHLPRIRDGAEIWCQGWSEPEAGSDLTAAATRAERVGHHFVVNGRKRWISWAQFATHCALLVRTGAPEDRHKGLSCLLVPMDTPGLTVRPIPMANGEAEENDLLLEDVRVPAENLFGPENGGWQVVLTAMAAARGTMTLSRIVDLEVQLRRMMRAAAARGDNRLLAADGALRQRVARIDARLHGLKYLAYRKAGASDDGTVPDAFGSPEKLHWSHLSRELAALALELEGPRALVGGYETADTWFGQWREAYMRAQGTAIEGGTGDIQRATIARRVLRTDAAPAA